MESLSESIIYLACKNCGRKNGITVSDSDIQNHPLSLEITCSYCGHTSITDTLTIKEEMKSLCTKNK